MAEDHGYQINHCVQIQAHLCIRCVIVSNRNESLADLLCADYGKSKYTLTDDICLKFGNSLNMRIYYSNRLNSKSATMPR